MKYLRKFNTNNDYNAEKKNISVPNISWIENSDEIKWHNSNYYDNQYLTTTALTEGTITFTMYSSLTVANCTRVSYSLDDGETWTTANNVASKAVPLTTPTLQPGQEVLWKGSALRFNTSTSGTGQTSIFSSTCDFNVSGNVMSMLYEDNFANKKSFPNTGNGVLGGLFQGCAHLINAQNLLLPVTTLVNYCYIAMFRNCTSLISSPKLKATTIPAAAYANMFEGCSSLVTTPDLPATTFSGTYPYSAMFKSCTSLKNIPKILPCLSITNYAYNQMFYGCTSLETASDILATTIGTYAYAGMFYGCTNLKTPPPALRATTCTTYCYSEMFRSCSSMTSVPQILATTMADHSCNYMFYACSKITSTPDLSGVTTLGSYCFTNMFQLCTTLVNITTLPNTTLAPYCYQSMFYSCKAITTAPVLPATTLADRCYASMFFDCSKLNYVKMMATDLGDSNNYRSILNWVYNVANSGTFVMNSAAQWYKLGISGIPKNWTIQYDGSSTTAQTYKDNWISTRNSNALNDCFRTTALTAGTITLSIYKGVTAGHLASISYSTNNGTSWTTVNNASSLKTISVDVAAGDVVLWKGVSNGMCAQMSINVTTNNYSQFSSTCNFTISGKLLSLLDGTIMWDDIDVYDYYGYTFANLFKNCTGLISAENLILPDTTCSYCFSNMFDGCSNLTKAPQLCSAHDIMTGSYQYMFQNCTSLTTAVAIGSIRCYQYSCRYMFAGCTGITYAGPISVIDIQSVSNNYSFDHAFYGCTSLIATPSFAPTTLQHRCCEYMFAGCTALTTVMPILPATGLMNYCYGHMFSNCPNITRAPVLPATAWSNYCYQYMFQNCSSLNYIKCMATGAPTATNHTVSWVDGVAASGTFVKNTKATKWTATGVSSIPAGWTVQTAAS